MIAGLFPADVVTACATRAMADEPLLPAEATSCGSMSDGRRREFALGRACARHALARLGLPGAAVPRASDRTPIWPDGIVGSLSHCDDFCGVAVAVRGRILGLGLDAEVDAALSDAAAERICTRSDLAHLASLSGRDVATWAKLVFSAKESFYKGYFPLTRTRLGFRDVEIRIDPAKGRFEARLVRGDAPDLAGSRRIAGRFAWNPPLVVTGVTISDPRHAAASA